MGNPQSADRSQIDIVHLQETLEALRRVGLNNDFRHYQKRLEFILKKERTLGVEVKILVRRRDEEAAIYLVRF